MHQLCLVWMFQQVHPTDLSDKSNGHYMHLDDFSLLFQKATHLCFKKTFLRLCSESYWEGYHKHMKVQTCSMTFSFNHESVGFRDLHCTHDKNFQWAVISISDIWMASVLVAPTSGWHDSFWLAPRPVRARDLQMPHQVHANPRGFFSGISLICWR